MFTVFSENWARKTPTMQRQTDRTSQAYIILVNINRFCQFCFRIIYTLFICFSLNLCQPPFSSLPLSPPYYAAPLAWAVIKNIMITLPLNNDENLHWVRRFLIRIYCCVFCRLWWKPPFPRLWFSANQYQWWYYLKTITIYL